MDEVDGAADPGLDEAEVEASRSGVCEVGELGEDAPDEVARSLLLDEALDPVELDSNCGVDEPDVLGELVDCLGVLDDGLLVGSKGVEVEILDSECGVVEDISFAVDDYELDVVGL